jgi:hypothetical protein
MEPFEDDEDHWEAMVQLLHNMAHLIDCSLLPRLSVQLTVARMLVELYREEGGQEELQDLMIRLSGLPAYLNRLDSMKIFSD